MNPWLSHFLLIFIAVTIAPGRSEDNGVCSVSQIVHKTRPKEVVISYQETYKKRCGFLKLKKCTKTRTQHRTVIENETYTETVQNRQCCPGYRDLNGHLLCKPICNQNCINSWCSSPNVCSCNAGFSKDPKKGYICNPVCSKNCVNGRCSSPEVCSCNAGHSKDPNNGYICNPVCSKNCVNGWCSSPEVCSCNAGHSKDPNNGYICNPVCSKNCVNGWCSSPEVCSCNAGYFKDPNNGYICNPVCNETCLNGWCSSPEVCSCNEGYDIDTNNGYICNPVCNETCLNGWCSSPEVCSCNEGYDKDTHNGYICNPVCNETCSNGWCSSPEVCSCNEGYALDSNYKYNCKPKCTRYCENNECSYLESKAINVDYSEEPLITDPCVCNVGYVFSNSVKGCIPYCKDCQNGTCNKPGVCECFPGFQSDDNNITCLPVCHEDCVEGFCSSPDTCTCFEGYQTNLEPNICTPICTSCVNGNCTQPELCECFEGYEMDERNLCAPYCSDTCINSTCVSPEQCQCFWGFQKNNSLNECILEKDLDICSATVDIEGSHFSPERRIELEKCSFLTHMVNSYKRNFSHFLGTGFTIFFNCSVQTNVNRTDKSTLQIVCQVEDFPQRFKMNETGIVMHFFTSTKEQIKNAWTSITHFLFGERSKDVKTSENTTTTEVSLNLNQSTEDVSEITTDSDIYSISSAEEMSYRNDSNTYLEGNENDDKPSGHYKLELFLDWLNFVVNKEVLGDPHQDETAADRWCLCSQDIIPLRSNETIRLHLCDCSIDGDIPEHIYLMLGVVVISIALLIKCLSMAFRFKKAVNITRKPEKEKLMGKDTVYYNSSFKNSISEDSLATSEKPHF